MESSLFQQFDNGTILTAEQKIDTALCAWNKHKDFEGVFIKHLITAEQTAGLFTCHLIRLDPHGVIRLHSHPTSIELHEVAQGSGVCLVYGEEIPYTPGTLGVMNRNAPHEVRAGADGLCLFAKFITVPA